MNKKIFTVYILLNMMATLTIGYALCQEILLVFNYYFPDASYQEPITQ